MLQKKGFIFEDAFIGYDYSSPSYDDYDSEDKMNESEITDLKFMTTSKDKIIKFIFNKVIENINKMEIKCDDQDVFNYVKNTFDKNELLYDIAFSGNPNKIKDLVNLICSGFINLQNYRYVLASIKIQDAKMKDLTRILQVQESSEKNQRRIINKYRELSEIDNQVRIQDANDTLATAAINMAMEELGKDADSNEVKKRSFEILSEMKNLNTSGHTPGGPH